MVNEKQEIWWLGSSSLDTAPAVVGYIIQNVSVGSKTEIAFRGLTGPAVPLKAVIAKGYSSEVPGPFPNDFSTASRSSIGSCSPPFASSNIRLATIVTAVLAVNEAQRVQGIFERGRDDGDFFRREDPTSVKKRPNSHNTNPRTRTSTTSMSWLKAVMAAGEGCGWG